MAEQQIANLASHAAPLTRVTKDSEEFELLAVNANFDGSGAASAFLPCVEVVSDAGIVVARSVATDTVAAGDTAEVTFAPFLGRTSRGTIRFERDPQSGRWLYIETTGSNPATGNAFDLVATGVVNVQTTNGYFVSASHAQEAVDGDWQIQAAQGGSGGTLELDSNDAVQVSALGQITISGDSLSLSANGSFGADLDSQGPFDIHSRNGLSEWSMDDGLTILSSGSITFQFPAGQVVEFFGALGLPVFKIDANGDLHGKTGKALVFDL